MQKGVGQELSVFQLRSSVQDGRAVSLGCHTAKRGQLLHGIPPPWTETSRSEVDMHGQHFWSGGSHAAGRTLSRGGLYLIKALGVRSVRGRTRGGNVAGGRSVSIMIACIIRKVHIANKARREESGANDFLSGTCLGC